MCATFLEWEGRLSFRVERGEAYARLVDRSLKNKKRAVAQMGRKRHDKPYLNGFALQGLYYVHSARCEQGSKLAVVKHRRPTVE